MDLEMFDDMDAYRPARNIMGELGCHISSYGLISKQTEFSIDLAIVAEGREGAWFRLIHEKTGIRQYDRWFWNEGPQSKGLNDKVDWLKDNHLWLEVRETYLTKKNLYLSRGDRNHPSFNCYIEAVNEVFHKYR